MKTAGTSSPAVKLTLVYTPRLKTQVVLDYDRRTDISGNFGSQALTFDTVSLTLRQLIGSSGKWLVQFHGDLNLTRRHTHVMGLNRIFYDADDLAQ